MSFFDSNINGNGGRINIKWSQELAMRLDGKDGKVDGKISASIWNTYLNEMGSKGNRINNYITIADAAKSFEYYSKQKDKGVVNWDNWKSVLNNQKIENSTTTPVKVQEEVSVPNEKTPDGITGTDKTPTTPKAPEGATGTDKTPATPKAPEGATGTDKTPATPKAPEGSTGTDKTPATPKAPEGSTGTDKTPATPKAPEGATGADKTQEAPKAPDTTSPVGTYKESEEVVNGADGIIDKASQGEFGDCWLITGLMSLSETKWGRQAIKNAIQINPDSGDIKITLKGAYGKQKEFNITKSELETAKKSGKYSYGDKDVLAFELAIEKYRKQFGETLDGGEEEEVFRLITGSHNTQRIESKGDMRTLIQKAKANPDKYAISVNFELGSSFGRDAYHAYNVTRFETGPDGVNYVILTNPWLSNREIKMTEDEFVRKSLQMQVLANPTGVNTGYTNNADGKIGNTTSSTKNSDKGVASAIYAVANSDPQLIKDCIKVNSNGSITVTLKGVGKSYTISAKELDKARDSGNYTQGDDDVLALEIAMEKYGKEQEYGNTTIEDTAGLDAGAVRAGTDISSISDSRAIFLLTGQENMYAKLDKDGKYIITDTDPKQPHLSPEDKKGLLGLLKKIK